MSIDTSNLWKAKLHARLHDPAEKALILMRTAHGHEGGTSAILHAELFPDGVPESVRKAVRKADQWASAADRAAFPNHEDDGRYPAWQQVPFHERPVIIHPLTGRELDLRTLTEISTDQIEALSLDHFRRLVHRNDTRATALAFWRFGPEIDAPELQSVWSLLPADTRVPDHSIWDHLDLASALSACLVDEAQDGPALLAVSLGPVQEFIASGRSTSDLWAGSHLLSQMTWIAMKVICEELGPEAILFPRLRGVPQVDVWLRDECGVDGALFSGCKWTGSSTDANPLFAAALPNRFTALVPAADARRLAETIRETVRTWALEQGRRAFRKLLDEAEVEDTPDLHGYRQLEDQLKDFPQVHWASVSWSLVDQQAGRVLSDTPVLAKAMQAFFRNSPPGYLDSDTWKSIRGEMQLEDGWFWRPNPGALYPALHELLERVLAADKSLRPFAPLRQTGWRCSVTGETEWLTTDESQLQLPSNVREQTGTLWTRVRQKRPSWVKGQEHLGAMTTLKRLWPTLFREDLGGIVEDDVSRFVVSTHTMAIAGALDRFIDSGEGLTNRLAEKLENFRGQRVSLPRRLSKRLYKHPDGELLRRLPGWMEAQAEAADDAISSGDAGILQAVFGSRPETYYGLILMDGDEMGAWVSGGEGKTLSNRDSFHPAIRAALDNRFRQDPQFSAYAAGARGANPARHMAISEALNHFSLLIAPHVVEEQHCGRVLYAGGDDVMGMIPVSQLLPVMASLRASYSGLPGSAMGGCGNNADAQAESGFFRLDDRLLRVMGERATASIGAVIAHHQAPLGAVLRELRGAERRAKDHGRNAFAISVVKRSGGALGFVDKWERSSAEQPAPMLMLRELAQALRGTGVSRRAAYNVASWTPDLPEPGQLSSAEAYREMMQALLHHQFERQGLERSGDPIHSRRLAQLMPVTSRRAACDYVDNALAIGEFLSREMRA